MQQVRRATTVLVVAILVVMGLIAVRPSLRAAPGPSAPDAGSPFGVAGGMRWPDWGSFERPAGAIVDAGAAWDREDFVWGLIEPREGQFSWTATDRIVGALAQRKVNVLGIISYSANWATPAKEDDGAGSAVTFYPPDLGKYAAFVRMLVARYKDRVHYWEVWNEPNNGTFWKPKPDARQYAELLKVAYKAVKDADPTAKVVSGGMPGNAVPFLEEMLAAGAGGSFDVLGIHPYAVPLDTAQGRIESRPDVHKMVGVELLKYRAFLQRHGLNKPLWVTEIGWPAGDWDLDEQTQADYLAQAYAQMLASGVVDKVFWYSAKDESASQQQSWGLTAWGKGPTDLAPRRAAFAAFATSARMLAGLTPLGSYRPGKTTVVEGFEGTGVSWARTAGTSGEFLVSKEQAHGGGASGRLHYKFTGANQAVDFAPPQPVSLPGTPSVLSLWVRGDGSGNYLSAWLKDRNGQLFKVRLGAVTAASDGWRLYEAHVNSYYFAWERTGPAGAISFPASVVAFRLENTPDEPAGSGTIYVDDLAVSDGPDVWVSRFGRSDGQVVDVVWAAGPTRLSIPTRSAVAQIVDRDGLARTIQAAGGSLTLQAGQRPVYLVHIPVEQVGGPGYAGAAASGSTGANPACAALKPAEKVVASDNVYFGQTRHNLSGVFKLFWEAHGGVRLLGYPITEPFAGVSSDGKTYQQQYFERARLELHPENAPSNNVQLGLLGVWSVSGKSLPRGSKPASGGVFFDQTGHGLQLFHNWWSAQGGLPVFGYPISEEVQEKNPTDGKTYTVQYFERNRLEYHSEFKGTPNEVMLGLLGSEYVTRLDCR